MLLELFNHIPVAEQAPHASVTICIPSEQAHILYCCFCLIFSSSIILWSWSTWCGNVCDGGWTYCHQPQVSLITGSVRLNNKQQALWQATGRRSLILWSTQLVSQQPIRYQQGHPTSHCLWLGICEVKWGLALILLLFSNWMRHPRYVRGPYVYYWIYCFRRPTEPLTAVMIHLQTALLASPLNRSADWWSKHFYCGAETHQSPSCRIFCSYPVTSIPKFKVRYVPLCSHWLFVPPWLLRCVCFGGKKATLALATLWFVHSKGLDCNICNSSPP